MSESDRSRCDKNRNNAVVYGYAVKEAVYNIGKKSNGNTRNISAEQRRQNGTYIIEIKRKTQKIIQPRAEKIQQYAYYDNRYQGKPFIARFLFFS